MLAVLRISNLAIIEQCEIELGPKLNVMTGETGAGKSIILKAVELLTGKRASSDLVRAGADRCVIEALFTLRAETARALSELADELVELGAHDELLIRRIIDHTGRSKVYVNGSLVPAQLLARITERLIDFTGQHQQQGLLDEDEHLAMLDQFGVSAELRDRTYAAYTLYAKAQRELDAFLKNSAERARYYEQIKAELQELDEAALSPGERDRLETELRRLANFETLSSYLQGSLELLEESEDSIDRKLRSLGALIDQVVELDPNLDECRQLVESATVQLAEAKLQLTAYGSSLDGDPARLEEIRERIAEIAALERKHKLAEDALCTYREKIRGEVAELEAGGLDEQQLRVRRDDARAALTVLERELTEARRAAAVELAKLVENGLAELNMKRAKFRVDVEPTDSGPQGADAVRFTIAANPGEPFRPLARVASGGELSRVLLILKTVLNEKSRAETQIFDEIDTGVGGAVAQAVGEKLRRIAARSQVLVVSHSPQVAACADTHFRISKSSSERHTRTEVAVLDDASRVTELAAMLAGKKVTANFEQSARELLQHSRREREKSPPLKREKSLVPN